MHSPIASVNSGEGRDVSDGLTTLPPSGPPAAGAFVIIRQFCPDYGLTGNWVLFMSLRLWQTLSVWVECCGFAFKGSQIHLSEVDLECSIGIGIRPTRSRR